MQLKQLRHRAGLLKYQCLSGTLGRYRLLRAERVRARLSEHLTRLPRIRVHEGAQAEIHMLCGASSVEMGIWASWSFLRFMPNASLYVHGDPTLKAEHLVLWRKVVEGLIFLSAEEDDARAIAAISSLQRLMRFRAASPMARKLIDVHLSGTQLAILLLDSDVLCFSEPQDIKRAMNSNPPAMVWNRDGRTSYDAEREVLSQISGLRVPPQLNSGLMVMPRFGTAIMERLNDWCAKLATDIELRPTHWTEQTLYAMAAGMFDGSRPLPPAYDVIQGPTPINHVVRHYVSNAMIRPLFYLEGLQRLANATSPPAPLSRCAAESHGDARA